MQEKKEQAKTNPVSVFGQTKQRLRSRLAVFLLAVGASPLALTAALASVPNPSALPQDPSIVAGQASVSVVDKAMTVQQTSQKAIVNWSRFDIGSAASVSFQQPNSSAATLNRVTGGNPSQIMGKLSANGQVYIVNPNGVIFGEGAQVNVAGLVASSMDISDENFLAGNQVFIRQGASGEIINKGTLQTTEGGYVLLLGAKISNAGTIKAPSGKVVAVAGDKVSVPLTESGLISIEVDPASVETSFTNETGALIEADDGSVYLSARAANDLASSVVNKGEVHGDIVKVAVPEGSAFLDAGSQITGRDIAVQGKWVSGSGTINASGDSAKAAVSADYISFAGAIAANSTSGNGGNVNLTGATSIMLSALSKISANGVSGGQVRILSSTGYVLVSGLVVANGTEGTGGHVDISGKMSTVLLGADVQANGKSGGGTIHIGGNWQGGAGLLRAKTVIADAKTVIRAEALTQGNGGEVVLWSDASTSFYGKIYARGGTESGNGGRVELSSAGTLNVQIASDHGLAFGARSESGKAGLLLLDPMNVVIGESVSSFEVFKALLSDVGSFSQTAVLDTTSYFGMSLALNDTYALIGARGVSNYRGDAFLYNLGTGEWTDLATTPGQMVTSLLGGSYFGSSVALNNTYALIGATGVSNNRGNAYLYNLVTGAWTDLATTPGELWTVITTSVDIGRSAALNDTYAVIGSYSGIRGNAYLYNLTTGAWTDLSTTPGQLISGLSSTASFSYAMDISDTHVLFGAYGQGTWRGTAILYNLGTGAWLDLATTAGQPITGLASYSHFGYSVALNDQYALMGTDLATTAGFAYLYNLDTGAWTDLSTTAGNPVSGLSVGAGFGNAVGLNDTYAVIAVPGTNSSRGTAYLYDLTSGVWTDLVTTTGQPLSSLPAGASFGTKLAISDTHILFRSLEGGGTGNAYLYNLIDGSWTDLLNMAQESIVARLPGESRFGGAVALNDDYALVGASYVAGMRGSAFLYSLSSGTWTDLSTTSGQLVTALPTGSNFGARVALSDTLALIGAPNQASGRGNALLYNLTTGAWTDLSTTSGQPVTALASNAYFGTALALNNTYALIGATGVSTSRGTAYLYNLTTGAWTNLASTAGQPITALASSASFGTAVALNNTYALIGASGILSNRGNAYLYNLTTGAWTDLATTSGQPITALTNTTYFGRSVALNDTHALIGAPRAASVHGSAYLYDLTSGTWLDLSTTSGQPVSSLVTNAYFGVAVAINNNYALIGSYDSNYRGNAYLYNLTTGAWTDLSTTDEQPITSLTSNAYFGTALALNDQYALLGSFGVAANRGSAYLYELTSGEWTNLSQLSMLSSVSRLGAADNFGRAVAVNEDYALIGLPYAASRRGNAFLYNLTTGAWTDLSTTTGNPITTLSSYAYFSNSLALNDTQALIAAYGASSSRGNAYLYDLTTGAWTDLSTTPGSLITTLVSYDNFGSDVALSNSHALFSAASVASSRGNSYLYNLITGVWTDLATTAGNPIAALGSNANYGTAIALNSSYALMSYTKENSYRGNAYLYNLTNGTWTSLASTAGQPISALGVFDQFGYSLAMSETYVAAGAICVASCRGNVYLYNLTNGAWTNLATTTGNPIAAMPTNANIGATLGINSTYVVLGTQREAAMRGNAYAYNLLTGAWTDLSTTADSPITSLLTNSYFSSALALSETYALFGAYGTTNGRGSAYLYNLTTGDWTALDDWSNISFGTSVALSDRYAVVGTAAYERNRGTAYVYDLVSDVWTDLANTSGQPITTLLENSRFGTSVALNDNYALLGASGVSSNRGDAYLYNLLTGAWTTLSDTVGEMISSLATDSSFGGAVALNDSYALIGASGVSSSRGNAYLYHLSSGAWTDLASEVTQPITALASGSLFGGSVALSNAYALIGSSGVAAGRGTAYLYRLSDSAWTNLAATSGELVTALSAGTSFGNAVALNDTYALIGASGYASGRGNAYLYNLWDNSWLDLATSAGEPASSLSSGSLFGQAVALNDSYALIGASGVNSGQGNAYLYNLGTGLWSDMSTMSQSPIPSLASGAGFGSSVALNDDYALVGAPNAYAYQGNAYLVQLDTNRISSSVIQAGLASGPVIITADNNITVKQLNLTSANTENGLTLQAGKSIVIQNSIELGGRSVSLTSNTANASLGDPSLRQYGEGGITVQDGANIDNSGGSLVLQVLSAGLTGRTGYGAMAGDLIVSADITAETLLLDNAGSSILIGGLLQATGADTAIVINGREVSLTADAGLSAANGRWMVYNTEPSGLGSVSLGSEAPAFYRYGCTLSGGCTTGAVIPVSGNGVVYAYAPTLTINGMNTITKVYDTTNLIDTSSVTLDGSANGDAVTLSAVFDDKNVGANKSITYSLNADYGYLLSGGASIGSITPAGLTISNISALSKTYDTTRLAVLDVGGATLGGVLSGDTVSVQSGSGLFDSKNVGTGITVTANGFVLGGTDAQNYEVTTVLSGLSADITPKTITYTTFEHTIYQGVPAWGSIVLSGAYASDSLSTTKMLVASDGSLLPLTTETPVGSYRQRILGLAGPDAGNYVFAGVGHTEGLLHIVNPPQSTVTSDPLAATIPLASQFLKGEAVDAGGEPLLSFMLQKQMAKQENDFIVLLLDSGTAGGLSQGLLLAQIQKYVPTAVKINRVIDETGQELSEAALKYVDMLQTIPEQTSHILTVTVQKTDGQQQDYKIYLLGEETDASLVSQQGYFEPDNNEKALFF